MLEILPWLVAMAALIGCSAFFSASEAALFSLRPLDRRLLAGGNPAQRTAAGLLRDPERVLSAVLFWNLVVNIAYFALAAIVERQLPVGSRWVWPLRAGSLLMIIFFSEMLPKTLAVLIARQLSASLSLPLSLLVRLVDPIMPTLRFVMLVSRRLVWPSFKVERTLEPADLERAIELSTTDAKLLDQEQTVLRNIVSLSELRADESMRPRTQLQTFRPPVNLADLGGRMPRGGYLLITEDGSSENVGAAVRLHGLWSLNPEHLEAAAEPVVYVPWCASVVDALTLMRTKDRDVAAVVNEWGETVGVLTIDDVLDVVFTNRPSRSQRLLNREPIQLLRHGLWQATGMTNLRRLAEYFELELPPSRSATVGGVVQERLQRIPRPGDKCQWGPFEFEVTELHDEAQMVVHVRRLPAEGDES